MNRRDDDDNGDDPRDAHLLAALRHAPDRDALPPREVSQRILDAARAAAQSTRPAAQPMLDQPARWWQRLSAWLTQPQVAASFGTLVVAALVGVMWSTREPPVAGFEPSTAAGTASDLLEAEDKRAVLPPPKATGRDAAAVRAESRARPKAEAPAAPVAATASAAPVPPAPPAPAVTVPQAADAAPPAAAERRASATESDAQFLARQQGAASARAAPAAGLSLAAKARAAEPLAAIDAALAAGALWQAAGSAGSVQHGPAQRLLWASVQDATRGRWEAMPPTWPPAPWLVLDQGSPGAILWMTDGALYVTAEGQTWRVPITAAQRDAWMAEVARW
jgi:hypothetical protein